MNILYAMDSHHSCINLVAIESSQDFICSHENLLGCCGNSCVPMLSLNCPTNNGF